MGARSILMPDVGEGVAEAEIVEWTVKVGDLVREDQVVAAVMTDKATVEIPTPVAGAVLPSRRRRRRRARGRLGAHPHRGAGPARSAAAGAAQARRARRPSLPRRRRRPLRLRAQQSRGPCGPAARAVRRGPAGEQPLASPAVRLSAREAGRRSAAGARQRPGRTHHPRRSRRLPRRSPASADGAPGRAPDTRVETVKVIGLRRRIAQNMAESKRRVAHFSYVEEVDVTALEELRAALNAGSTEMKPKLTLLPFLMLGIVKAVADFPQINAHYDDEEDVIRRFGAVHLGVATQTPTA